MQLRYNNIGSKRIGRFDAILLSYIIATILVCSSLIVPNDNLGITLSILAIIIFAFIIAWRVHFDILHPFMWFNIPFVLFSISASVQYLLASFDTFNQLMVLHLNLIALACFSLGVGQRARQYTNIKRDFRSLVKLKNGNTLIFVVCGIVAIITLVAYLNSGMSNKQMKNVEFSSIYMLDFVFNIMNLNLSIYIAYNCARNKLKSAGAIFIAYSIFILIAFLINGERSILYRHIIICLITFHVFGKRITMKWWALFLLIGLGLQIFLGAMKMFLLTGTLVSTIEFNWSREFLLKVFLGSEIQTPSTNLGILLEYVPDTLPYQWGASIVADVCRALVPGFMFPRESFMTSSGWFTEHFFTNFWNEGGGVGFSLVGVGYLNFGIAGVIGLFGVIGYLTGRIYSYSNKNALWAICYICFIPVLLSSIRADISGPISQFFKHVVVPLIVIIVLGNIKLRIFSNSCDQSRHLCTR